MHFLIQDDDMLDKMSALHASGIWELVPLSWIKLLLVTIAFMQSKLSLDDKLIE